MKPAASIAASFAAVLFAGAAVCCAEEPIVRVALKPYVETSHSVVNIGDVASVRAADPRIEEAISQLDLADAPEKDTVKTVSREQLRLRLELAGVAREDAAVSGAPSVQLVFKPEPIDDDAVLNAALKPLADAIGVPPQNLDLRLAQPLTTSLTDVETDRSTRLEARVDAGARPGLVRIPIAVFDEDRLLRVVPVSFECKVYRMVGKTTSRIEAGEAFTSDNVAWESAAVAGPLYEDLSSELLEGRVARRALTPGVLIRQSDVAPIYAPEEKDPIVIRSRDLVRVTAKNSVIRVVLSSAQAMQQGRVGDTIRLKNTDTGKIISGRVIGPGEVELEL